MSTLIKRNGNTFPSLWNDFFDTDKFFGRELSAISSPDVNITESEKDYSIELAAPGLERKDFKVEVGNNVLSISAEKQEEKKEEKKNYWRREFAYNSFSRSFTLPENSLPDKIDAKYENGILRLTLPKKEAAISKPKKEVKVA